MSKARIMHFGQISEKAGEICFEDFSIDGGGGVYQSQYELLLLLTVQRLQQELDYIRSERGNKPNVKK